MKKLLALLVASICALSITFTACLDFEVNTGTQGGGNEQTDGSDKNDSQGGGNGQTGGNDEDDTQGGGNGQTGGNDEDDTQGGGNGQTGGNDDDDTQGGGNGQTGGNDEETPKHECKYETVWTQDGYKHWHASLCSEHPDNKGDEAYHEYTSFTGKCKVCNEPAPTVFSKGYKVPYFSFDTYSNSSATYSTESAKGKVLVINFWYKTCGICVEEMPFFENTSRKYGDDIEVIALHASNGEEGQAETTISNNGWSDYKITFGLDKSNIFFNKFGGKYSYPLTVVVDTEGVIVKVIEGMVKGFDIINMKEYDYLTPAIEEALGR